MGDVLISRRGVVESRPMTAEEEAQAQADREAAMLRESEEAQRAAEPTTTDVYEGNLDTR